MGGTPMAVLGRSLPTPHSWMCAPCLLSEMTERGWGQEVCPTF